MADKSEGREEFVAIYDGVPPKIWSKKLEDLEIKPEFTEGLGYHKEITPTPSKIDDERWE